MDTQTEDRAAATMLLDELDAITTADAAGQLTPGEAACLKLGHEAKALHALRLWLDRGFVPRV